MNIGVLFGVGFGILMIVIAAGAKRKLAKCSCPIQAQVVDYADYGDDECSSYRPVVEYTCEGEKLRRAINAVNSTMESQIRSAYPLGTVVTIYIDPENPGVCTLNPVRESERETVFICAGILVILVSLCNAG